MPPAGRDAFVRAYGPDGDWAALFAQAPGFIAVTLLVDTAAPERYVTLDRWVDEESFRAFRADPALAVVYAALDRTCAALTTRETALGSFDESDV